MYVFVVQVTWTFVTFEFAVPLPFVTRQVCAGLDGCVSTVTLYALPPARGWLKVNAVAPEVTDRLLPPLSCSTSPLPV